MEKHKFFASFLNIRPIYKLNMQTQFDIQQKKRRKSNHTKTFACISILVFKICIANQTIKTFAYLYVHSHSCCNKRLHHIFNRLSIYLIGFFCSLCSRCSLLSFHNYDHFSIGFVLFSVYIIDE